MRLVISESFSLCAWQCAEHPPSVRSPLAVPFSVRLRREILGVLLLCGETRLRGRTAGRLFEGLAATSHALTSSLLQTTAKIIAPKPHRPPPFFSTLAGGARPAKHRSLSLFETAPAHPASYLATSCHKLRKHPGRTRSMPRSLDGFCRARPAHCDFSPCDGFCLPQEMRGLCFFWSLPSSGEVETLCRPMTALLSTFQSSHFHLWTIPSASHFGAKSPLRPHVPTKKSRS